MRENLAKFEIFLKHEDYSNASKIAKDIYIKNFEYAKYLGEFIPYSLSVFSHFNYLRKYALIAYGRILPKVFFYLGKIFLFSFELNKSLEKPNKINIERIFLDYKNHYYKFDLEFTKFNIYVLFMKIGGAFYYYYNNQNAIILHSLEKFEKKAKLQSLDTLSFEELTFIEEDLQKNVDFYANELEKLNKIKQPNTNQAGVKVG
jgi:hypothetical protein